MPKLNPRIFVPIAITGGVLLNAGIAYGVAFHGIPGTEFNGIFATETVMASDYPERDLSDAEELPEQTDYAGVELDEPEIDIEPEAEYVNGFRLLDIDAETTDIGRLEVALTNFLHAGVGGDLFAHVDGDWGDCGGEPFCWSDDGNFYFEKEQLLRWSQYDMQIPDRVTCDSETMDCIPFYIWTHSWDWWNDRPNDTEEWLPVTWHMATTDADWIQDWWGFNRNGEAIPENIQWVIFDISHPNRP